MQVNKRLLKYFENTMNVTTVLEEKIVLSSSSDKIQERERSISPSSFYGQQPNYQSHVFSLIYPVGEFSSFKEMETWSQSEISPYCFVFGVDQENQEAGRVQNSLVQPQWWKSQTQLYLQSRQTSVTELPCKNSQRPSHLSVAARPSVKVIGI